jgi:4-hydroxy-2-oxoheptanedioate aldolase
MRQRRLLTSVGSPTVLPSLPVVLRATTRDKRHARRGRGVDLTGAAAELSVAYNKGRSKGAMANRLKQIWASGKAAVNGWLAIPSGFSAEVMAQCGFDSVTVDLQHGVQDYQSMVACFQAMQAHPVTPLVRVPWNETGIIGKVLDAGAGGVICPMVNTRAQAEAFVAAAKYPPRGIRSNGPIRAGMYGLSTSYQSTANEETLALPMIETREAVANLTEILDVPGVAGVYVGPSDLGFSFGLKPVLDRSEPEILQIYDRLVKETGKRGQYAGIHCGSPEYAARAIGMGFRLVTILNDSGLMAQAASTAVSRIREASGAIAERMA